MKGSVTVLGINGRIGQAAATAFVNAGFTVAGFGRSARAVPPGVTFRQGTVEDTASLKAAIADADIVVNALNLPYHKWYNGRAEAQLEAAIAAMKDSGKTMLFPGNVYNYSPDQLVLRPDTPQKPPHERGAIRKRMEDRLKRAAREDGIQVAILRAGDFYGPGAFESWFDLGISRDFARKAITYPGEMKTGHSWAYLPDLGRAFAVLGEKRDQLGAFESFQFSGHFATGEELVAAVQAALPERYKVKKFFWWMLALMAPFSKLMRSVYQMRYLWKTPQRLEDPRLETLLGEGFHTPFKEAVARTARSYLPQDQKAGASASAVVVA
ncbi:NAD-dependent epimerase/dehydratase family protein [Cucumibacter marinus]|uniref:NAD-dependent epimerase/dehydratase family protein n=1 Tax=Cucumibacter marinus TaxID=1121252 RepID=UPI0004033FF3|nr:NAD-dependent epimerase/dehydratase family protein [Cucumibacter marinus]